MREMVAVALAIGFGIAAAAPLKRWLPAGRGQAAAVATTDRDVSDGPRREVLMVVLVSAACTWSTSPGLADSLRMLRRKLQAEASKRGFGFSTLGVAVDHDVSAGVKLLSRLGPFDQVAAGNAWLNVAAVDYIWRDVAGEPGLPQVVLVRRTVSRGPNAIVVGPDLLLERAVGPATVSAWLTRGATLLAGDGHLVSRVNGTAATTERVRHE